MPGGDAAAGAAQLLRQVRLEALRPPGRPRRSADASRSPQRRDRQQQPAQHQQRCRRSAPPGRARRRRSPAHRPRRRTGSRPSAKPAPARLRQQPAAAAPPRARRQQRQRVPALHGAGRWPARPARRVEPRRRAMPPPRPRGRRRRGRRGRRGRARDCACGAAYPPTSSLASPSRSGTARHAPAATAFAARCACRVGSGSR